MPILHTDEDKNHLHRILIRLIYNRIKVYAPTDCKVLKSQFENGLVVNHKHKVQFNAKLLKQKTDTESRLLNVLRERIPGKLELQTIIKGETRQGIVYFDDFVEKLLIDYNGKLSEGRLKHYKVIQKKIKLFKPGLKFGQINLSLFQDFERTLREKKLDGNTVQTNMKLLKSVCNKAAELGYLDESQYKKYKIPKYDQKLIEYLTEEEIKSVHEFIDQIEYPSYRLAGQYFLLSCYTGYRISDATKFDYAKMVSNGMIVLRTRKNKTIVSIPIHSRLGKVLEFVKDNPLELSERKVREYVKEICKLKGIKKNVKFHTSRHSFAMLLMKNGFSMDEVAELLGDTLNVARIYAKIHNESLNKKILERLG
jgi:site-specific recombinase XerD